MKIINCKEVRDSILQRSKGEVAKINQKYNASPSLVVVQVKGDDASNIYVRNKKKTCEKCGIKFTHIEFDNNAKYEDVKTLLLKLAEDSKVDGILLQLPLPAHLKKYEKDLINTIPWQKDVDGLTVESIGRLWSGLECIHPCTAEGIMNLLPNDLSGKNVLVINRSMLIGKPLVALLQSRNATVTLAHSKSMLGHEMLCMPDIIITAVGKHGYLNELSMFEKCWLADADEDYMIVDAAITRNSQGKLCGDIDLTNTQTKAQITPVPGGVGILTTAILTKNTILAFYLNRKYENKN